MSLRVKKEDLLDPDIFIAKAKTEGASFVSDGERFFLVQFGNDYPKGCECLTELQLRKEFTRRSHPDFNYQ